MLEVTSTEKNNLCGNGSCKIQNFALLLYSTVSVPNLHTETLDCELDITTTYSRDHAPPDLIAMFCPQVRPEPKLLAGMTDPYINETVTTYAAEPDEKPLGTKLYCHFFASLSST